MKALLRKIRQILRDRKTRRIFTRLVSTVAAIVVFVTTYALVLPAITMESEAACGIEAHQHDQSCYTDVLVCELSESPGHVHDESCYITKQKQACQIEEHVHDSDCYDGNGKLICEKDEHQHGEDCFEEVRELVCEIPESPGHQHDDSCYQKVLTCGREVHTHSTACYRADTASQAATEAIAVASTESAAAAATGNGLVDNLNDPAESSESETSLDSSIENNVIEGNLDASPDYSEPGSDSPSLTNEGDKDEPGAWTSTEAAADATAATAASTGSGAGVTGSTAAATGSSTGGTAATAAPAGATDTMSAAAGYVPVLDELNFDTLLNKHTGIYYSRLVGTDSAVDNEIDGTDAAANKGETQALDSEAAANNSGTQAQEVKESDAETNKDEAQAQDSNTAANTGEMESPESTDTVTNSNEAQEEAAAENTGELQEAVTWNRTDKHTELKESDNLRLYLAYTIPAGSLNETNQTARYSLPQNIRLTDEQIDEINTTVNGIAGQYVSYDTLEILDQEMYGKYLGIEAVEGTRTPADNLDEYLANNEGQEFISATVKVENVFDENTGLLKAQDLVFTFAPYTIQKNQHQYDSEGQPIKAGEEVNGWLAIDISTEQIDWEKADDETKTADIIFVEKDKKSDLKEISTELRLVEAEVDSDTDTNVGNAAKGVGPDVAATDNKQDGTKDSETAAGESDKAEKEPVSYPSVSFDDSITVVGGALSTDTDEASGDAGMAAETEITVHVEADKDTFPEGTTMVLSTVSDDQMTAVAEAVEGAVDAPKTMGFHAVDISFRDVKGNEIEPLKPIRVSMTSDAIRRAVQDESTAPVVVHVSDPSGEQDAADENMDDGGSTDTADADEAEGADSQYIVDSSESTEEQVPGSNLETTPSVNIIETDTGTKENNGDTLIFEAEAFSVYAIVYTVDFHHEINGKMYEFTIPGGGFVSFYNLVELLGIEVNDTNTEKDEIRELVDGVESITFSSPELVSVNKVEEDTTVGAIEDRLGLECKYSAELTEDRIEEINAQEAKAGDWALISVQPFTSEEMLTVTMKNGDQWTIRVTDEQISDFDQLTSRESYILYIVADGKYYALNGQGNTVLVPDNNLDALSSDYLWRFNNQENGSDSWDNASSWVNLSGHNFLDVYYTDKNNPVVSEYNTLNNGETWLPIVTLVPHGNGFYFRDLNASQTTINLPVVGNWTAYQYRFLKEDSNTHRLKTVFGNRYWYALGSVFAEGDLYDGAATVYVYKQGSAYTVRAQSNDETFGHVRYTDDSTNQQTTASNTSINVLTENSVAEDKAVTGRFEAVPETGYIFTGWTVVRENSYDENEVTKWGDSGVSETSLSISPTVNGNLILQANFKPEKQYKFTVTTNDETMGTVGGGDEDGKTLLGQKNFTSVSGVVIDNRGRNEYELSATRKPLYKFVEWQLKDSTGRVVRTFDTETIPAKSFELTGEGMTLTAIFQKKTDTEIDEVDIDSLLGSWKTDMTSDFVGVDKTAHVHDYENRIYEIDLSASSGKWAVENNIDMDFITDTSRSMYFPANLEYAKGTEEASSFTKLKSWLSTNGTIGETYYVISADNTATMYAVHYEGNEWKYRDASYYYYWKGDNRSSTPVPDSLNLAKTITGKIYKSRTAPMSYQGHNVPSSLDEYWSRLDYLYKAVMTATETLKAINPQAGIHLTTFNKQSFNEGWIVKSTDSPLTEEQIFTSNLTKVTPSGGTRQDEGLYTSRTGEDRTGTSGNGPGPGTTEGVGTGENCAFADSSHRHFAILVTDGAPNGAEWGTSPNDNDSNTIFGQANRLKAITDDDEKPLTLMTLGISLNFVNETDRENLADVSSDPSKYAKAANNGGQIVTAIEQLVQNMVVKAALFGTVSDTVDSAFYPVKADGTPITAGYYDMNGNPYSPGANDTNEYCRWTKNGDSWSVTYYNQTFKWPTRDENNNITENGWDRTFYVKAKENFLGGNTIETNSVGSTTFTGTHTILLDNSGIERPSTKAEIKNNKNQAAPITKNDIPTPHVNIKQLSLTENETKWTVYIQTGVDPLPQIKELYNNIKVLEVVDKSTNNMITSNSAMLFTPGTGTKPETFLLSEALGKTVSDIDWSKLTGEPGYIDIPYTKYDHSTGYIRLTLTKGESSNYDYHQTSTNLIDEEEYVLSAQFIPYTEDEMLDKHGAVTSTHDKEYHTTPMKPTDATPKSPGAAQMDGKPSVNNHIIELFVRGLSITKATEDFSRGLPGAEFTFYRPATTAEIVANTEGIEEFDGVKYVPQQELSFDDRGVAYINGVKQLNSPETNYYLVETKAPEGYTMLEDPIPVTLTISDTYTLMPVEEGHYPVTQTNKPASGMFNWEQKAKLEITELKNVIKRTTGTYDPNDSSTDLTDTPVVASSQYEVMYYRIKNEANTVDITFQKVDERSAGLPGAVFQLIVLDDEGTNPQNALSKEGYTGITGLGDVVEGDTTYGSAIRSDGTAQAIGKLPEGKYRLVERVAPAGYIIEKSEWNFEIKDGAIISRDEGMGDGLAIIIANKPGAALPSTGGPGTTLIYLLGIMLIAFVGACLVMRRRIRDAA